MKTAKPPQNDQARAISLASTVTIAIITALEIEQTAIKAMLDEPVDFSTPGKAPGEYILGTVPAKGGGRHTIVLVRSMMGENLAAANTTIVLERFPASVKR